jgi:DNA invertase Pin-like site-specific DNA recombinase
MSSRTVIHCAIYTRKSSEEGLDQEFNSLDAQYEACSAYIASQKHEGWKRLPERFDDGGVSGGTLERPALQRLLAGIEAGRIDMVVVYKIDRLTRALADFVRLVERLDVKGCSFVSVNDTFAFLGLGAFTNVAGQLHFFVSGVNIVLEGDVTGDGVADFQIQLNGIATNSAGDLVL